MRGGLSPALPVADASVMPEIVSVNTQAASTAIGWLAAGPLGTP